MYVSGTVLRMHPCCTMPVWVRDHEKKSVNKYASLLLLLLFKQQLAEMVWQMTVVVPTAGRHDLAAGHK